MPEHQAAMRKSAELGTRISVRCYGRVPSSSIIAWMRHLIVIACALAFGCAGASGGSSNESGWYCAKSAHGTLCKPTAESCERMRNDMAFPGPCTYSASATCLRFRNVSTTRTAELCGRSASDCQRAKENLRTFEQMLRDCSHR